MSDVNAELQITEVLGAITEGLRKKDPTALVNLYSKDAVLFDLAPPLAHRIDRGELSAWLDTWDGPVNQTLRNTKVLVRGDLAFAYGLIHVSARTKAGEEAAWWMRSTTCLVRQSGRWVIVHEHDSVPFHMDGSFRAALDLSP